VAGNGRVDFGAGHPLLDVRIIGDGFQRYVGYALVDKPFPDVPLRFVRRRELAGEFGFLLRPSNTMNLPSNYGRYGYSPV